MTVSRSLPLLTLLLGQASAWAEPPPLRPASGSGVVLVPESFLRRWDPITVFFPSAVGRPGPEDKAERWLRLSPPQPGAYQWLDGQTLQFRPAEPWPALTRVEVRVQDRRFPLSTLMAPPERTLPADGAEGLPAVDALTLVFPEPLPPAALSKMVRVELRPLPGLDPRQASWLLEDDFEVKVMERKSRADKASYVLWLRRPIGPGIKVRVHFHLSLDDGDKESFSSVSFSTQEPFRVLSFGCRGRRVPASPEGSRYGAEQVLRCGEERVLQVEFSAAPAALGAVEARNLVRFNPAPSTLDSTLSGRVLEIRGDFAWETAYQMSLHPTAVSDERGRPLDLRGKNEVPVYFPRQRDYLQVASGDVLLERHGPQMIPLAGRGDGRLDLRIHRVDPLDRSLWPFQYGTLAVDESARPPGPGEEPRPHQDPTLVGREELIAHLRTLSAPQISRILDTPLSRDRGAASFGLDLAPLLAQAAGARAAGSYLVGVRRLDGSKERVWTRVQVTDLSLSTVEDEDEIRFVLTRLSSGEPVKDAVVRVEGEHHDRWVTFVEGRTAVEGAFVWRPTGVAHGGAVIRRVTAASGDDLLVIDAARPPERYEHGAWRQVQEDWISWAVASPEVIAGRRPRPATLCHLFSDRPVYRPEETVHLKGYVRSRHRGQLSLLAGLRPELLVQGPGNYQLRRSLELNAAGAFDLDFREANPPTGDYRASLHWPREQSGAGACQVSFKLEAYRLPSFEVRLSGQTLVPIDQEFEVGLIAGYYSGGPVVDRPVRWRVSQFPLDWTPPKPDKGFYYSTDARFSRGGAFAAPPELSQGGKTDTAGAARLKINPALDSGAQPRSYVIEATVTGDDDQTVSSTRQVRGVPAFTLGLKVPRFLERAREVKPEVLVVGPDGAPLAGKEVVVRLIHRVWHSYLRASDFSDGSAKYVTDVVEEKLEERKLESGARPLSLTLALPEAGVYLVELEARDRLGRAQTVAVDFFAGGERPQSWAKPEAGVFKVVSDKPAYEPGETARFLLQSPFQSGRVLVVAEEPDGNRYEWLEVKGGAATYSKKIEPHFVPRMPLHFVLLRGRLEGTRPTGQGMDLGKPTTLAATQWVEVKPVENTVQVKLSHAERARPGDPLEVQVKLTDAKGRPLAGEVCLWLVDQAVLALGKEQPLDPVPSFITPVQSRAVVHDLRNRVLGRVPYQENPGGGDGEADAAGGELLDRVTVRRNFQSVPYWKPDLQVGPSGVAKVEVKLPDNLTLFKLRAKAVSGAARFGFGTSEVAVRLPVQVQPALPRFVRNLDQAAASALVRVVEGEGGPGEGQLKVEGGERPVASKGPLALDATRPVRLPIPLEPGTRLRTVRGLPAPGELVVTAAAERKADQARDAFQLRLPVLLDRTLDRERKLLEVAGGARLELPALATPARPGTVERRLLFTEETALVRMAAGLDFLREYPHGAADARLARARVYLALKELLVRLGAELEPAEIERAVRDTFEYLARATGDQGLVAQWPGWHGRVFLTASAVELATEARRADLPVDQGLEARWLAALERALRADYPLFVSGETYYEQTEALRALTRAGRGNPAYSAELARKSRYMNLESVAAVVQSLAAGGEQRAPLTKALTEELYGGVVFRLHQGRESFGGLQDRAQARSQLILPSETRTLAEIVRAATLVEPDRPRLPVLVQALVTLGQGDGWGSTNANAAALFALAARLDPRSSPKDVAERVVEVREGGKSTRLRLGPKAPSALYTTSGEGPIEVSAGPGARPIAVRADSRWLAQEAGDQAGPVGKGFVVTRRAVVLGEGGAPATKVDLSQNERVIGLTLGQVVEEQLQLTNPADRHYVAVVIPLAAGMEALNPALETAPAEAKPSAPPTLAPSYVEFLDDRLTYYYESLPKGNYELRVRTRASTPGKFVQPAARAELMYDATVYGSSWGGRVEIKRVD